MKKRVRKWMKPYLRRNGQGYKKKFSKVRGHYIWVEITVPGGWQKKGKIKFRCLECNKGLEDSNLTGLCHKCQRTDWENRKRYEEKETYKLKNRLTHLKHRHKEWKVKLIKSELAFLNCQAMKHLVHEADFGACHENFPAIESRKMKLKKLLKNYSITGKGESP